jgi:hypothetical protein
MVQLVHLRPMILEYLVLIFVDPVGLVFLGS